MKVSKNHVISGLIFLALAVLEFILFKRYCRHFLLPYYLVNYDQLAAFCWIYDSYYRLLQEGVCRLNAPELAAFKGVLVPFLGTLFTFLFGANRFAILLVNFFFLMVAQFFLLFWSKKPNLSMSCLAIGFFLLIRSHLYYFGGLNDVRLDYAGMVMMGIAFLTTANYLQMGERRYLLCATVALILLDVTRFVTMFYWLGGLPRAIAVAIFLIMRGKKRGSFAAKLPKRLTTLLLICLGIMSLHLLLSWASFGGYYVHLKTSGEDKLRWLEFGVHNAIEQALYFPNSFLLHFHDSLMVFVGLIVPLVVLLLFRGRGRELALDESREKCAWLLFLSLLITTCVALSLYSPSPIVISAYAIPLVVSMSLTLSRLLEAGLGQNVAISISVIVMLLGVGSFSQRLYSPAEPPHCNPNSSRQVVAINSYVANLVAADKKRQTVLFMVVHEGLNIVQFKVTWCELKHCLMPNIILLQPWPFPAGQLNEFVYALKLADVVVAPIVLPAQPEGGFEYPNMGAIRDALPQIHEILSKDFKLSKSFDGISFNNPKLSSLGVYVRRQHLQGEDNPHKLDDKDSAAIDAAQRELKHFTMYVDW